MTTDRLGLVPAPVSLEFDNGVLVLGDGARVAAAATLRPAARWWRSVTENAFGIDLVPAGLESADAASDGIAADGRHADVVFALAADLPPKGYRLTIGATVRVDAADLAGAHAAAQTLRQVTGTAAARQAPLPLRGGVPSSGGVGTEETILTDPGPSSEGVRLPRLRIEDHPRFTRRGVLLDVARHFLPKYDVLRFIDLIAMHKFNVLQLHLTDDQGWRFDMRRFPELTQSGAWRAESTVGTWRAGTGDGAPHGGFYTQDDLREIVAYARERGVEVVPEIDVPGHVEAAVAAYPFLGTRKSRRGVRTTWGISEDVLDPSEESLAFFRHVLDELVEVFDGPWIHLGGDEVPTERWESSPQIRARAAQLGFGTADKPDVSRLHGWFLARLADHVRSLGRRAMVWDEALGPDLPADVAVVAWQAPRPQVASEALAAGHDVVIAPEQAYYLDHRASAAPTEPVPVGFVRTLEDVLAHDPLSALCGADPNRPAGRLLGAQAQVWTEHLDSARRIDYAAFPRLAAIAEVLWSPQADRSPGSPSSAEFLERLARHHLPRLDAYGVEYRPLTGPHPWQRRPGIAGHVRDLAVEVPSHPLADLPDHHTAGLQSHSTPDSPRHTADLGSIPSGSDPRHPVTKLPANTPRPPNAPASGPPVDRRPRAHAPAVHTIRGARLPRPDGTLSPPQDLHLAGGRIETIEQSSSPTDEHTIDADGRIALPGLIDAHSHAEGAIFDPQVQHALLRQGVTTVVTGQDGVSYAPGDGTWPGTYFGAILGDHPTYRGPRVRDLLATYDDVVPVNVAYLAPHGTIRHEVLGSDPKRATLNEIAQMTRLLRQALDDGACGLSTGLEYRPGGYADERELIALTGVVASRGLPHVSHMRGYEDKAGDGFAELVRIARASGVATHISHYHGPAEELTGYVDTARAEGLDLTFDTYPYLRGCSTLAMVSLPGRLPLADPPATVHALRDDDVATRLRRDHFPGLTELWPRITFASVPSAPGARVLTWAEGRTLLDVAGRLGMEPADAVLEILIATELRATCVFAQPPTNNAESVRALANHAAHLGGSDAIYLGGRPHPRGWGAFARLLAEHVGSGDWTWHAAAEHLSGRAARRFGLGGRGVLDAGAVADVVLVDPDTIRDRATYDLPRVVAAGIDDVLVAGVPVLRAGHLTDHTPGHSLRPS